MSEKASADAFAAWTDQASISRPVL